MIIEEAGNICKFLGMRYLDKPLWVCAVMNLILHKDLHSLCLCGEKTYDT